MLHPLSKVKSTKQQNMYTSSWVVNFKSEAKQPDTVISASYIISVRLDFTKVQLFIDTRISVEIYFDWLENATIDSPPPTAYDVGIL